MLAQASVTCVSDSSPKLELSCEPQPGDRGCVNIDARTMRVLAGR